MNKNVSSVQELITPTITAMGYELLGCLYMPQGNHSLLRVYIDSENGINIDDCERVSRQVSALLDVEDPIRGGYTLEVSSPGSDRPLFTQEHFERFINEKAEVRLLVPMENRRQFKGVIKAVNEGEVIITIDEIDYVIALKNIARANLIADIKIPKRK